MYDPTTAQKIMTTPKLKGLDNDNLPDILSRMFAEIVSTRFSLRDQKLGDSELVESEAWARRLAYTNEALVAAHPDRNNKTSAAFVGATAHQLVYQIKSLRSTEYSESFLTYDGISSDIAAMLLFLIGQSPADASEVASQLNSSNDTHAKGALIHRLKLLGLGQVGKILNQESIDPIVSPEENIGEQAVAVLYNRISEGISYLAEHLAGSNKSLQDPIVIFENVKSLSAPEEEYTDDFFTKGTRLTVFPGPFHLASLLTSVASSLLDRAIAKIKPPSGVNNQLWYSSLREIASTRPYLWPNHQKAISEGYLEPGVSAVVAYPTGAGKSTISQLKINTALLLNKKAIFLAPTHALIAQTVKDLRLSLPKANIKGKRADEIDLLNELETLPNILVLTPEACLLLIYKDPLYFQDVGVLVFDECHLIHPRDAKDRRSIDAMLCLLNFVRVANNSDIILQSAMLKNTGEIAEWLEELIGRKTLDLSMEWKPTRQLRGCVVYEKKQLDQLNQMLRKEKLSSKTIGVPKSVEKKLFAKPYGFFSVQQTWQSKKRNDYSFLPFHKDAVPLSANKFWKLTPNSGVLSASLAVSAALSGVKTLIFAPEIPRAVSISNKAAELLGNTIIELNEEERRLYQLALDEMGHKSQLYILVNNGCLNSRAAVHHGQLIPEERLLIESLYKRDSGLSILSATPTLGQGMNLPSELVIISDDSRFDQERGGRSVLEAQDLLNAAGRAGRAGQNATGMVIVIPGQVTGLNDSENQIGQRWANLREIFSQSDQCLTLDDPITAVMDNIHAQSDNSGDLERYLVSRLASTDSESSSTILLSKTFAAFKKRKKLDSEWIDSRTQSALSLLGDVEEMTQFDREIRDISSSLGLPEDILHDLKNDITVCIDTLDLSIFGWCSWIFNWLEQHPEYFARIFRLEDLEYQFGSSLRSCETDTERAIFAIPLLKRLLAEWMEGQPLNKMQESLPNAPREKKKSTGARKFVIRLIPTIAHFFGAPALLLSNSGQETANKTVTVSSSLKRVGHCVRSGYSTLELSALGIIMSHSNLSRREMHQLFEDIKLYISPGNDHETWEETISRVSHAAIAYNLH
ncbi:DEAD/DEAH box helicase [Cobetia sp. MC34]|uniref:DEAD/DEAH box helicase n=1 Tax=Cobetia sp. MC34 TaxID=2785080 RepID=UPI001BC99AE2|nr:DEAD/DEAH box helicase [Cobetia sp. MC34]MBS4153041.1 DEAD/DEAH box helicase [Cobetia sp. MC34]